MVKTESIKETVQSFLSFLMSEKLSGEYQSSLVEYQNYVKSKEEFIINCLNNLTEENAIHLYYCMGGLSRYFSEFNWFDEKNFYEKTREFLLKLNLQAQELMPKEK